MDIRNFMNEHRSATAIAALGVFVVALGVIIWQFSMERQSGALVHAYFTIDDGQTWFVGNTSNIAPFDYDGKQAVRAYVFKCGDNGKPFVGYLERFTDNARRKVVEIMSKPQAEHNSSDLSSIIQNGREVKKPGSESQWVGSNTGKGKAVITLTCPQGESGLIETVEP